LNPPEAIRGPVVYPETARIEDGRGAARSLFSVFFKKAGFALKREGIYFEKWRA
jgi:hypothetical protein